MNNQSFNAISALRIYMKNGDNRKAANWWGRLWEKPLSTYIVRSALKAGIVHAAVNLGHIGFAANAQSVSHDHSEIPMSTMPVCIELLASKRLLEQFIRQQAKHLAGTTLVMVEGMHISSLHLAEIDTAMENRPHSVEYITGGDVSVEVDHIVAEDEANEAVG